MLSTGKPRGKSRGRRPTLLPTATVAAAASSSSTAAAASSSTAAAAQAVFTVNELFQQILLELPMKTLLLSQRVDKHWHSNISESVQLQKKLFLLPADAKEIAQLHIVQRGPGRVLHVNAIKVHRRWEMAGDQSVLVVNPLLTQQWPLVRSEGKYDQHVTLKQVIGPYYEQEFFFFSSSSSSSSSSPPPATAMEYPEASWRKMFLAQPPPAFMTKSFIQLGPGQFGHRYRVDIRLTMQQLVYGAKRTAQEAFKLPNDPPWNGKAVFFGPAEVCNMKFDMFGYSVTAEDLRHLGI